MNFEIIYKLIYPTLFSGFDVTCYFFLFSFSLSVPIVPGIQP
jgi:hypothetical protein